MKSPYPILIRLNRIFDTYEYREFFELDKYFTKGSIPCPGGLMVDLIN